MLCDLSLGLCLLKTSCNKEITLLIFLDICLFLAVLLLGNVYISKEDSEEKDVEIDNLAVGNWDTETPSQHSYKTLAAR